MTFLKVNTPVNKPFGGLMNELFNELPATFGKTMRENVLHFPPVNIIEKNDHYVLELSSPGMNKSDFIVKVDDHTLTISAEKKETTDESADQMIHKEFSFKSFKRSFTVDEKIDVTGINAKYENGLLILEIPKKQEIKKAVTEIKIQ